ncbi:ribonuclease H family protein [Microbacterium neungamense]|uniref:ribonuclease H family protein n=1 Tax=Microbacterium neungamense TaxID=2810535 RepID=UPI00217E3239|nr:RNase H family protein [Microbacterium neungamense]UWF77624.1 ribonuclease HI [Microbacterium neungamense]
MTIIAAADGSALGNPGPMGWAWYIDENRWAAGGSPHGTNNQGELQAVLELLRATAGTEEPLLIECDSRYVIDSVTKWMPGWKRRGWRKSDGGPVLNRELLEGIDEAMRGREVRFSWVKGHAGHPANEAADARANAAAKAYQLGDEPRRGPGFSTATDAGAALAGAVAVQAAATATNAAPVTAAQPAADAEPVEASAPRPPARSAAPVTDVEPAADAEPVEASPRSSSAPPLWAEPADLLDALDAEAAASTPIELRVALSPEEHARLRDRADAQGVSLEEALRRLI